MICSGPESLPSWNRQVERQQVIGAKAQVDIRQLDQAVDREPAAGEQRQRERELAGNERVAEL